MPSRTHFDVVLLQLRLSMVWQTVLNSDANTWVIFLLGDQGQIVLHHSSVYKLSIDSNSCRPIDAKSCKSYTFS